VKLPCGVTVIDSAGPVAGGVACPGLMVAVAVPTPPRGSAFPGVPAVAVTGTVPLAVDGTDVVIVTGG
jgi:hypothetical protein